MTIENEQKYQDSNYYWICNERGISYINKRYSKANNKYCPNYDKTKPEKYITYLDMNNLYRHAMSQYLRYGGFKWIKNSKEIVNKIINKIDNSLHGYFLEVDLEYPEYLHNSHKDYSLASKKVRIKDEWLSTYCLEIKNKHDIKTGNVNKLTPNLMSKKNYVVHYRNLKYYLSQGLIFKKVHRILEFKQRVDFGYDIGAFFLNETRSYWEKYNFYNDDGTISYLKLDKNMQVLDLLISEYTNDKELTLFPKELKTDLVVLFL